MIVPRAPTRRGWSLLEVAVALALVVVIGALAAPVFVGMTDRGRLDAAREAAASAVLVCRAEAQRRGVPMELTAQRGRLEMRRVASEGDQNPPEVIAELPEGVGTRSSEVPESRSSEVKPWGVCWPNGSVEFGAVELRAGARVWRGKVSAWTGAVAWEERDE